VTRAFSAFYAKSSKKSRVVARGILLLTGVPGIGKTTVIRQVADRLKKGRIGGFYTEEIREHGDRRGFRLVGFDGTERVIAHVDFPKTHRVGRYGVDVGAIDEATVLLADDRAVQVYLVDGIGKMECLSERFVAAMRTLLIGPKPVVATIARRGGGFIAEAKRTEGAAIWEVTRTNRDLLPSRGLRWLGVEAQSEP
jgi:nucleoside-triphosphatase